jgi:phosphatidylglycerol---prolipoprotein diacylglyceryl transferase
MWEQLMQCAAEGQGRVAFCIPWPEAIGGPTLPIFWYGILASAAIFIGAFYASKHVEWEGGDPDIVWDALLWVLIPALIGARLWYVGQAVIGSSFGAEAFAVTQPSDLLKIINSRQGGMNIIGGAIFGLVALVLYVRTKKINGWLLADGAMMGLLVGQAIGRVGNYINKELYGPPTGSDTFGIQIPLANRLPEYASLPENTLFHPTMFYEMAWLLLCFGVLLYIFRRYQEQIIQGTIAGWYLILAGFGRFIIEFFRPDQPKMPEIGLSYSQLFMILFIIVGIVVVLDRLGYMRIPWIARAQTQRQRTQTYQKMLDNRERQARAAEKEKLRIERRKARAEAKRAGQEQTDIEEAVEES